MRTLALNAFDLSWFRTVDMSAENILIMLGALGFLLLISKVMRKKPIQFPRVDNTELEHYTLGFEETYTNTKKISLLTKVVLFAMCLIIVFTPLQELLSAISFY